jgi:hypothetical protein
MAGRHLKSVRVDLARLAARLGVDEVQAREWLLEHGFNCDGDVWLVEKTLNLLRSTEVIDGRTRHTQDGATFIDPLAHE